MCLMLFAYEAHPRYRLLLAANRDEYYGRPTAPAAFWPQAPTVLAGRDLQAGGTWLGVTRGGRLAAVTNFRDPIAFRLDARSRGRLVSDFLTGRQAAADYMRHVAASAREYNGFSLVLGDSNGLYYYSNGGGGAAAAPQRLTPGVYGLSNHLLDTPWPKVQRGKQALQALLALPEVAPEALLALLADSTVPEDAALPRTGVGIERERLLASIFVAGADYGTRSSTVLSIGRDGHARLTERSFSPAGGAAAGIPHTVHHAFQVAARD